jgi:hypothetical protein
MLAIQKLRKHLGAVIATMKCSADWHDFKVITPATGSAASQVCPFRHFARNTRRSLP